MRACLLIVLLVFLGACAGSISGESATEQPVAAPVLSLTLAPEHQVIVAGEAPELRAVLANAGESPVQVVEPLDGSDVAWRQPHCLFELLDAEGRPVSIQIGRCGNTNLLQVGNFREVPAKGALELYGPSAQSPYFGAALTRPGTYTLRFTYATDAEDLLSWMGGPVGPDYKVPAELVERLAAVPPLRLTSNAISIVVTDR